MRIFKAYRAAPLAKNPCKGPETSLTSRPGLPCARPFSATPIAICASECQKHIVKCTVSIFWLILSLLASIFKPSCSKMPSRWSNIEPSCSKTARLDPPILKKPMKTLWFFKVFQYLACYPNGSKMLPKSTEKPPNWSQNCYLGGSCWPILALLGRHLRSK